jgi:hypothetical protein
MGRASFVAWLFVTAAACVVIAIGERSFGWLIGGLVLFSLAIYARRQFKNEQVAGQATPRFGFVGVAILIMLLAIYAIYWLSTSA